MLVSLAVVIVVFGLVIIFLSKEKTKRKKLELESEESRLKEICRHREKIMEAEKGNVEHSNDEGRHFKNALDCKLDERIIDICDSSIKAKKKRKRKKQKKKIEYSIFQRYLQNACNFLASCKRFVYGELHTLSS